MNTVLAILQALESLEGPAAQLIGDLLAVLKLVETKKGLTLEAVLEAAAPIALQAIAASPHFGAQVDQVAAGLRTQFSALTLEESEVIAALVVAVKVAHSGA